MNCGGGGGGKAIAQPLCILGHRSSRLQSCSVATYEGEPSRHVHAHAETCNVFLCQAAARFRVLEAENLRLEYDSAQKYVYGWGRWPKEAKGIVCNNASLGHGGGKKKKSGASNQRP